MWEQCVAFSPRFTYTYARSPALWPAILLDATIVDAVKSASFFAREADRLVAQDMCAHWRLWAKGEEE